MPKPAAAAAFEAAIDGAKADAEWIAYQTEPDGYELGETGKALAVILTDPRLRAALDPKALEQARRAIGLVDETGRSETR
jgi:ABC-type amino acid transport substrate-binding protein